MRLIERLAGRRKEEAWRQLCRESGAELVDGGRWKGSKVQARYRYWTLTLDTYTVSTGHSSHTYTRIRAPYLNADGFRFTIYRKGFLSALAKLFGMQAIEVGHPEFDRDFMVKGSDQSQVRALFAEPRLSELILAQPSFLLQVKDHEGRFGPRFPPNADELYFQVGGVITDVPRLKSLFEIHRLVLAQLCCIGSAVEQDPQVDLEEKAAMQDPDPELLALIAAGNKIGAIRHYRIRTGAGLEEAKDAVDALEARGAIPHGGIATDASASPVTDLDTRHQVEALLREGNQLAAVKLVRERSNLGLKEAKDRVDAVARAMRSL